MTGTLLESVATIEQRLAKLNRKVVGLLQSGLRPTETQAHLLERGLSAQPDLVSLFQWRNGTDAKSGAVLDDLYLVPGFYFPSLQDSMANYDSFLRSSRWQPGGLPLLANGGGDFLTIDLGAGNESGAIRHFRIEQVEHPLEYRSLNDMFATFAQAYQAGIFFVDASGFLEVDYSAYATLAARVNPHVEWWTA